MQFTPPTPSSRCTRRQLLSSLALADDGGDGGRRNDASLTDHHGEVLHRRHVVQQLEQLEVGHVAPICELASGQLRRRRHQVVGVAKLVVADGIEVDALGELVRLTAHQHRRPTLMSCHRDQRRARTRDERAVEQHRRRAKKHLGHFADEVRERVQLRVLAAHSRLLEPAQHVACLEPRAAVNNDHAEGYALCVRVQQRLFDDGGPRVDEQDVLGRDLADKALHNRLVGKRDALVDEIVDQRDQLRLGISLARVRGRLSNALFEPLDHIAHGQRERPAIDQVLDLLVEHAFELTREHLCRWANEVGDDLLESAQLSDDSSVRAWQQIVGNLQAEAEHGRVDVAFGDRCCSERGLALVLRQVLEKLDLLMCVRPWRDLLLLHLLHLLCVVVLQLGRRWTRHRIGGTSAACSRSNRRRFGRRRLCTHLATTAASTAAACIGRKPLRFSCSCFRSSLRLLCRPSLCLGGRLLLLWASRCGRLSTR
mmetsp:Transcript_38098/g.89190  ORF Transcript_38098/g.89190 Transcript_38098/m.89190 type:complete len:482 (-) Transcript_38098:42-1487(-)